MDSSTFWQNIKAKLKEKGLKQEWLCLQCNIPLQTLRNCIYYKRWPGLDSAYKIARALNVRIEDLLEEAYTDGNRELTISVPLIDQLLSAGKGEFLPDQDFAKEYIPIPSYLKSYAKTAAALTVRGDSMEPTFFDGDIVVCDGLGWQQSDAVYALHLGGSGYIKRVCQKNGKWIIHSDNPSYKEIIEPLESTDIRIIGRIRYATRDL